MIGSTPLVLAVALAFAEVGFAMIEKGDVALYFLSAVVTAAAVLIYDRSIRSGGSRRKAR